MKKKKNEVETNAEKKRNEWLDREQCAQTRIYLPYQLIHPSWCLWTLHFIRLLQMNEAFRFTSYTTTYTDLTQLGPIFLILCRSWALFVSLLFFFTLDDFCLAFALFRRSQDH